MNNNSSVDQRFFISQYKEIYENNNNLLTSIIQSRNHTLTNENVNMLVNNLINSNNEIMRNIDNLINLNTNANSNNRQQHSARQQNNRQQNNRQSSRNNGQSNLDRATEFVVTNILRNFLEPIEIYPTSAQIETATRVARYGDIVSPLNTSCPITLENFNEDDRVLIIRHCNHVFSNSGLISWFRSNCRCPVCRYDIRNYVSEYPNNTTDMSGNLNVSSSILPSPITNTERRLITNSLNTSNLLNDIFYINIPDNNTRNNPTVTDLSGNLLRLFFRD
jgi:hypothetical protein